METITFNCRFITPAFLGGGDPKGTPELRPPSIKGALRFWWRAMNANLPILDLKKREADIFGGFYNENGKEKSLQSKVTVRVQMKEEKIVTNSWNPSNQVKYMAYGAEERSFFDVGTRFVVLFSFDDLKLERDLRLAFSFLSQLGGLGAKSRNGFGSFQCDEAIDLNTLLNLPIIQEGKTEPKFTGFSEKMIVYQTEECYENYRKLIELFQKIHKDFGRKRVDKNKRHLLGAPYPADNPVAVPARHSKLHLYSAIEMADGLSGLITYLPYDYLTENDDSSTILKDQWQNTIRNYKDGIWNSHNWDKRTKAKEHFLKNLM